MKKLGEKLFIVLFTVSLLLNLRQCSDSQSYNLDIDSLEHEIIELESEISNKEKIKKQESKKPSVEVKEVKKFKPRIKAPEIIDSIDSIIPKVIFDSTIVI